MGSAGNSTVMIRFIGNAARGGTSTMRDARLRSRRGRGRSSLNKFSVKRISIARLTKLHFPRLNHIGRSDFAALSSGRTTRWVDPRIQTGAPLSRSTAVPIPKSVAISCRDPIARVSSRRPGKSTSHGNCSPQNPIRNSPHIAIACVSTGFSQRTSKQQAPLISRGA